MGYPLKAFEGCFSNLRPSPGLGICEFVFHVTVSETTTIQTSKRKQVSEFSFEYGKVISML